MAKPIPTDRGKSLLNLAETLILGASGGTLLGLLGLPAGWLSGAMLFVAVAAVAGRRVGIPNILATVLFISIGISLGAVVTPETLKGVATWPFSIAVLTVAIGCVVLASLSYLRLVHGWDAMSAFLASTPGALSQTIIIATATNADVKGVAVVQTMRVVILTLASRRCLQLSV